MQIHVNLFSILRNCLPPDGERGKTTVSLCEGATFCDLLINLKIDQQMDVLADEFIAKTGWQVIINGVVCQDMAHPMRDEDQVYILPPIAGG